MNSFSQVESTLKEILDVIKPLREDWVTRFKIIDELREVVQSMESLRGATVEPFGSFVSNLFTRSGDLDISIELPYGSFVSSAAKKRKLSLLGEILRALRQTGRWQRLQFIPHARVPILKIESKWQNISCDISIDNLQGQIKSKFMFWLNEIDGRFREMVLLVKEWAKAHGINNPKTGTFNSYSLSLLVIFHFQTCVPAIFPPLKDIYPGNVVDDLTGVRADAERRIAEVCSSNIARFKSGRLLNRSSLAELFISFIAKFSDIDSKASVMGICPFRGQWDYITSNTRWLPQTYAIFIEDPFEQPVNAARAVSQKQLITISDTFETTRRLLISANLTQSTLIDALVGPQTSQFLVKQPVSYSRYNGTRRRFQEARPPGSQAGPSPSEMQPYHYRNGRPSTSQVQPQAQKMMFSTSQMQNQTQNMPSSSKVQPQFQKVRPASTPSASQAQPQFQKVRAESYPGNFATQRPVQPYHNQIQGRIWRPKSDK